MRNHHRERFIALQLVADVIAISVALFAAFWLRLLSSIDPEATISTDYLSQFYWTLPLWILSFVIHGAYVPDPHVLTFNRARRILYGSLFAVMLMVVRNYFFRQEDVSRWLYPMALVFVSAAVIGGRLILQQLIRRFLHPLAARRRVIIVGLGTTALRLAARCKLKREMGLELVGFVSVTSTRVGQRIGGAPVLGTVDQLRRIVREQDVEEVFVTQTTIPNHQFFQLFLDSENSTARVSFVPTLAEMMRTAIHYDEVSGIPLYTIRETPLQGANAGLKRAVDVVGALCGLILLSPLFAVLALLVRRSSPGPILYRQRRLSLDGRMFHIYKFRTMPVDAELTGPTWGAMDDQRATPIGGWLRRTNLDELPQLFNVLRGDISLVGPRPERPVFVEQFRELIPRYMARHAVKTGMTGWAQVHGFRGATSVPQRLRYDLYYIENWSMWLDLKIVLMTLFHCPPRRRSQPLESFRTPTPFPIEDPIECPPIPTAYTTKSPGLQEQAAASDAR